MIEYLVRVQEWTQHFQRVLYRPEAGVVWLPQDLSLGIDPDLSKIATQRELTLGT
jgi:hypothetical protein